MKTVVAEWAALPDGQKAPYISMLGPSGVLESSTKDVLNFAPSCRFVRIQDHNSAATPLESVSKTLNPVTPKS